MIWETAKFQIPKPIGQTHAACLMAAERLGWKVKKDKPQRVRLGIRARSAFVHVASAQIAFRDDGEMTAVKVKAINMKEGPLARAELGKCLDSLEEAIRLEAEAHPSPT